METGFVERHIRALALAKSCAELGARTRNIACITGLEHHELVRLLFIDQHTAHRGRPPSSPDWYHQASLAEQVQAAIVVAGYVRMRELGFDPADAMISGYRRYREYCAKDVRISFDRAFDLVCHTEGIWLASERHLQLLACLACRSRYLATLGELPDCSRCSFCKLIRRYRSDSRMQAMFPPRSMPPDSGREYGLLAACLRADATG